MFDKIFNEIIEDGDNTTKMEITFLGKTQEVEVCIRVEDYDKGITQVQRDAFEALMQNWDEMQHKIASAILKYYNESEKGSYGPDDEFEFKKWWPDIDSEEQLAEKLHFDTIIVEEEFLMELHGKNPIYVLFDRDWGGEDWDDNGVAVMIEDGDVSDVGYKDMAF